MASNIKSMIEITINKEKHSEQITDTHILLVTRAELIIDIPAELCHWNEDTATGERYIFNIIHIDVMNISAFGMSLERHLQIITHTVVPRG